MGAARVVPPTRAALPRGSHPCPRSAMRRLRTSAPPRARVSPEASAEPAALVLHNLHPQDKDLSAILLTGSRGLKAMPPRGYREVLPGRSASSLVSSPVPS